MPEVPCRRLAQNQRPTNWRDSPCASQPKLGDVVSGIRQRADQREGLLGSAPVTKPGGKLPPGMMVATVGTLAHLINLIALGQAVRLPPPVGIHRFRGW